MRSGLKPLSGSIECSTMTDGIRKAFAAAPSHRQPMCQVCGKPSPDLPNRPPLPLDLQAQMSHGSERDYTFEFSDMRLRLFEGDQTPAR